MSYGEARLTISLRMGYEEPINVSVPIAGGVMRQMRPVDLCHDAVSALLSGSEAVSSVEYERVEVDRRKLADFIARSVTNELMRYMESCDTEQGYSEKELGRPIGGRTR